MSTTPPQNNYDKNADKNGQLTPVSEATAGASYLISTNPFLPCSSVILEIVLLR